MLAAPRGRPLILIVLGSLLTLYIVFWRTGHIDHEQIYRSSPLYNPDRDAKFLEDAHRLPDADSFLPHFYAVTKMKPMTFKEAESGCTYPENNDDKHPINFQYGYDVDWAVHPRSDEEIAEHQADWHDFIRHGLLKWTEHKHRFNGRGIVILGGNGKSFMRLLVTLRALVRLGCKLPVEIHHWDDELFEKERQDILKIMPHATFHDLAGPNNAQPTYKSAIANFHFKVTAMLNSKFAEPMLIDSDNIPVVDPEVLYDSPTYKEYGTIFWPDIARTRKQNPAWAITNTRCRMDEWEQESGQLLINKTKFFYHLQLAYRWSAEQRYYYGEFLLGDKDMFRFAWHALKTQFGVPRKWITSVGTYREADKKYCGHTFAQHHPDTGDVVFMHGGLLKSITDEKLNYLLDGNSSHPQGIFQVYKRSSHDEDKLWNDHVIIDWEFDDNLQPPQKPGWRLAVCTQFFDVEPRPLDELVPNMEQMFQDLGGYWFRDVPERPGNNPPPQV